MPNEKYPYLPTAHNNLSEEETAELEGAAVKETVPPLPADTPCPCCGNITIPNDGDALAYICPVCCWEIDRFIHGEDEPSDLNHGLTLRQARENYRRCGAVLERLKACVREPKEEELPR